MIRRIASDLLNAKNQNSKKSKWYHSKIIGLVQLLIGSFFKDKTCDWTGWTNKSNIISASSFKRPIILTGFQDGSVEILNVKASKSEFQHVANSAIVSVSDSASLPLCGAVWDSKQAKLDFHLDEIWARKDQPICSNRNTAWFSHVEYARRVNFLKNAKRKCFGNRLDFIGPNGFSRTGIGLLGLI